ncbi:Type IV leader peptidase family protein [Pelotomaculum sp. FP]|uniref:prepilin peptidase n=1 Tax=Pelotomaculum sp. FP TaxID=261474 RepID=UPI001065888B|nr:prepilin peptidase [Pelotomaculum sp. FP]TEB12144.1 Type IV leader peptidase family protein [Pelotomaculum sp. FP]
MELVKTGVFLCVGLAIGFIIPSLAQKMIQYKCTKRHQNIPAFYMLKWHEQILMLLSASLFALAGWQMPLEEALLVCVFVLIALTATVIDTQIRIIANEIVLLLLALGIIYRIIAGGAYSLSGSLGALGFVVVIFGGTALITKLFMKNIGIGAGDIKLAMAIAITVGYPGIFNFLGGMAVAIGGYCVAGLQLGLLTPKSTFPMCGHIMAGLLIALFVPYIPL